MQQYILLKRRVTTSQGSGGPAGSHVWPRFGQGCSIPTLQKIELVSPELSLGSILGGRSHHYGDRSSGCMGERSGGNWSLRLASCSRDRISWPKSDPCHHPHGPFPVYAPRIITPNLKPWVTAISDGKHRTASRRDENTWLISRWTY